MSLFRMKASKQAPNTHNNPCFADADEREKRLGYIGS